METSDRASDVDLGTVIRLLWDGKRTIVAAVVLTTVLFTVVAFVATPMYRASAVVIESGLDTGANSGMAALGSQLGGLANLAGINIGGNTSRLEESLAVLTSREFTERFIRDKDLMKVLFEDEWNKEAQTWKGDRDDWPSLVEGFRKFDEEVRTASFDTLSGLVSLDIEWEDPELAADWANELIVRLNDEMRQRAIQSANDSIGYLESELEITATEETRQAISRLLESQIRSRMLANVTQEYVFRVVDKALPPDERRPVWPRKGLLIASGFVAGLFIGIAIVLLGSVIRRSTEERSEA